MSLTKARDNLQGTRCRCQQREKVEAGAPPVSAVQSLKVELWLLFRPERLLFLWDGALSFRAPSCLSLAFSQQPVIPLQGVTYPYKTTKLE
ncbi:hypothetical protein AOLI_G00168520 [Acnodon oligacanthus]